MALGADRGILVEADDSQLGALEVAKILKGVVEAEQPQLILLVNKQLMTTLTRLARCLVHF